MSPFIYLQMYTNMRQKRINQILDYLLIHLASYVYSDQFTKSHCQGSETLWFYQSILLLSLVLPRFDSISIEWFLLNPLTTLRLNVLTYKIYFSVSKITLQLPMSISCWLLVCLSVRHQNPQAYQNQSFIHPSFCDF